MLQKKIDRYRFSLGHKKDQSSEEENLLDSATSSEEEEDFEIKEEIELPKMPKVLRKRKAKEIIPGELSKRVRINNYQVIPIEATNTQFDLLSQTLDESGISFDTQGYTFKQEEPEWNAEEFLSNAQFPIMELEGEPVINPIPVNITGIKGKELGLSLIHI